MRTLLAIAALLLAVPSRASEAPVSLRRFALVAGANDGGPGRVRLRYATSDAQSFARVLEQLGGVRRGDTLLLTEPRRADFLAGLEKLGHELEAARQGAGRLELLVYYSGHSDETGLLLGGERLGYPELKQALGRLPADVRVAILDSCASGALLRTKGGTWLSPLLVDTSGAVRGQAFLTATSAKEAAQESDGIRASFFTHSLVTGLRGAADTSRDGRVTLHEAYQFAFNETLARTERTQAGPQHPAYDMQLAGTGDLVLTDLRGSSARLVLGAQVEGRLYLRDASGRLAVELRKERGSPMELGLEPGAYVAALESGGVLREGRVELVEGRRVELAEGLLRPVEREAVAVRGGAGTKSFRVVPVGLSLFPPVSTNAGEGPVLNYGAFNMIAGHAERLYGFGLGVGVNIVGEEMYGMQLSAGANLVGGTARGVQVAAGFNQAGDMTGAQLGVLNIAGAVRGAQVGVVNVARRVSMPIGLINVADDADAPLGLINVVRQGYMHAAVWSSDLALANVGLKMGGRYLYTLLGLGMRPGDSAVRWMGSAGLGWHVPADPFYVDVELVGSTLFSPTWVFQHRTVLSSLRLVAGWQPLPHLGVMAGPTLNVLTTWGGLDFNLARGPQYVTGGGDTTVRVFPGAVVGLQL